jgi:hypothetical protein
MQSTAPSSRARCRSSSQERPETTDPHHNFIGEIKCGNVEMSLTALLKIAKAVKVKVRDLVNKL